MRERAFSGDAACAFSVHSRREEISRVAVACHAASILKYLKKKPTTNRNLLLLGINRDDALAYLRRCQAALLQIVGHQSFADADGAL